MVSSKPFIVAGVMIGVAIVVAVVVLFYQTPTATQTSNDNNNLVAQPMNDSDRLQAGDIITLSDGQKAIAFPLVEGFYKGKTLLFIHTDASTGSALVIMWLVSCQTGYK